MTECRALAVATRVTVSTSPTLCVGNYLCDWFTIVCSDIFRCEQTAFLTAYSGLLGTTLTSDAVWRYFFKAIQRPSLLPKDSAEFRGWYDTLPQTQPKDSEAHQGWQKAAPMMQPKDSEVYQGWHDEWQKAASMMQPKESEAFREWLQAVCENVSKQSVDAHL